MHERLDNLGRRLDRMHDAKFDELLSRLERGFGGPG
jgi:hypothetical protein